MRNVLVSLSLVFVTAAAAHAQQAAQAQTPRPPTVAPQPMAPPQGRPAAVAPTPAQPPLPQGQPGTPRPTTPPGVVMAQSVPAAPRGEAPSTWQNIKLEVSITDSMTAEVQTKKVVSLLVLDGRSGQVRAQGGNGVLNIDASPQIRADGRIYLHLTVEYMPELTEQQVRASGSSRAGFLNESLSLIVTEGRSITVSQSADPRNDRRVTMDVTATVIK
jgi:hypothetical protein